VLQPVVWVDKKNPDAFRPISVYKVQLPQQEDVKGHTKAVTCVWLGATILCSGSADKTIRVWHLGDGQVRRILSGHTASVWCIKGTTDERYLVSGSADCTAKVWHLVSGTCIRTVRAYTETIQVRCLALCVVAVAGPA